MTEQPRTATGIPGLDTILSGGFLRGATITVHGSAGAGKTVFAHQLAFHQVATGADVVYVTLLAESHTKLIAHLRPFSFFDARAVGNRFVYLSGYKPVHEGLGPLLAMLQRELVSRRPGLLVLDSVTCLKELHSPSAVREFLHELQISTETVQCSTLLLTAHVTGNEPEEAAADALLSLVERQIGIRPVRELQVEKLRGSAHLSGPHTFVIDQNGLTVFPRIEALHRLPSSPPRGSGAPLGFDNPELESMLGGGLAAGSSTLVLGATGTGKTLLGLSFLAAGLARGEAAVYTGFYDMPERLIDLGESIGLNLREHVQSGRFQVDSRPPVELLIDAWAARLLQVVRDARPKRLFIDGLNAIHEGSAYPDRLRAFFTAICNELRALDVATIIAGESHPIVGPTLDVPVSGISPVVENTILLRYGAGQPDFRRQLAVLKVRESAHDTSARVFAITSEGLRLDAAAEPRRTVDPS
jgi:circadian clock protein KaiC